MPQEKPFIPRKAAEGLQFRVGQIDHAVSVLQKSIASSSFLYRLFSMISLTFESRLIKELSTEKTALSAMQKLVGHVDVLPESSNPTEERKALTASLQKINRLLANLVNSPKPNDNWNLYQAELVGLKESLKRVAYECQFIQDKPEAEAKMGPAVVKQQAEQSLKETTDPGRTALLAKMIADPGEHSRDVNRITNLIIGKMPFEKTRFKANEAVYNSLLIARSLKEYCQSRGRSPSDQTINELLSAVSQSYLNIFAHPVIQAVIQQGYFPLAGAADQVARFSLSGATMVITRAISTEVTYQADKPELQGTKIPLEMTMQCRYNLDTKKVTYTYSYAIDNKKKTLPTTTNPFGVQPPEASIQSALRKKLGAHYQS